MIFTYKTLERLLKIFFSAIILQLFAVCLCAGSGCYTSSEVLAMLEYASASCVVSLGSAVVLQCVADNK